MIFLLKIALPPVLVAIMSLAARWWGPTVGGLIMGLPWMTGPVLFFLAYDKGTGFGVGACTGIQVGVVCICCFMLAYGAATAFAPWPLCLAAAMAAFGACAWLTYDVTLGLWPATGAAALGLAITYMLLPRSRASPVLAALPWWDIPARMAVTFALVAVIMLSADLLGPQLSGIVSTYPAILTVIGAFTHHQWGRDAVRRVLRALTLSLFAFVMFFLVVGTGLPALGLAASFTLAALAATLISGAMILLNKAKRP